MPAGVTGRPPRGCRAATSLPEEGSSQAVIKQQRRSFELELRSYTGDDPLDVWDRYVGWTLQAFPQGGRESRLNELLQRSVLQLANEKKYQNDARYVNLWIQLAQNSKVPGDTFGYMKAQGVGLTQAALYVAWSEEFEKQGDFQKADAVLQEGLKRGARPADQLQQHLTALQGRVSDQAPKIQEEEEPGSPLRTSMVDLRPRGRRKTPVTSHKGGLNLPVRRSVRMTRSAPGDEYHAGPSMGSAVEAGQDVSMSEAETQPQRQQHAVPFQIFDESGPEPPGNRHPVKNYMADDVFLPPGESGLSVKIQYPRQSHMQISEQSCMYKSFPERTESLNEEPVAYTHRNMSLSSSPDDTKDFARAAQLASTPCAGLASRGNSSPDAGALTQDLRALVKTTTTTPAAATPPVDPQKKLSPIHEASLEASSSMASLSSQGTQSVGKMSRLSRLGDDSSPTDFPREDPCALDVRRRLLDEINVGTLSNFHSMSSPMPTVEEHSELLLGREVFHIFSKVADGENFSIYQGIADETNVVMKVESSTVPWDFYIGCRARQRLAGKPQAPTLPGISCYAFHSGCVTVYKVDEPLRVLHVQQMYHELMVVSSAIRLLELVRNMHSCGILLGALPPHTLLSTYNSTSGDLESIMAVDLSSSVDLQLQPGVTSARQVASAWPFINQGLLEPSSSPYQVDLLAVADTIHLLLTRSSMRPVKDDSGWTVEEYSDSKLSGQRKMLWGKFFRTLLNPSDKPSVSVLSELQDMWTAYAA